MGAGPATPYRLAVFDFDGTLADSFPFFLQVFDTVADTHGFRRLDRTALASWRGLDTRALMRTVGLPMWKMPRVMRQFHALMAAELSGAAPRVSLFEGVETMLRALAARGVMLALLSSNSEANVRAVLGPELAALFAHYACGVSLFGKRQKLRRLLSATGLPRAAVLCIGDELRDLDAAHSEGLAFGAVTWGYSSTEALSARRPDYLFNSIAGMLAELAGHSQELAADQPSA
jgi:phosphoglycolate phosphatase